MLLVLAVVFGIVFVVQWRREPRRLSNGLWAVLAVGFGLLAGASLSDPLALPFAIALLLLSLAAVVSLPVTAAFLIGNGVVMLRRERPTPGNLAGLAVGLGLVGLMVVIFVLLLSGMPPAVVAALWLALVASYFAFVFVCFAAFCLLYARRRRRRPVEAVVVLGSGVRDGRVSPLLAARLARAIEVRAEHQAAGWPAPVIIPSGGQGPDEIEPEGVSMARWLREHDVPEDAIVVEPRARTTEENLRFSADLLAGTAPSPELGVGGPGPSGEGGPHDVAAGPSRLRSTGGEGAAALLPVPGSMAVVTNDYHAFRAALQARRLGLDADAVGARTASYFVPSAYLREFVAVLRENVWLHLIMVGAITLGIGVLTWNLVLTSLMGG